MNVNFGFGGSCYSSIIVIYSYDNLKNNQYFVGVFFPLFFQTDLERCAYQLVFLPWQMLYKSKALPIKVNTPNWVFLQTFHSSLFTEVQSLYLFRNDVFIYLNILSLWLLQFQASVCISCEHELQCNMFFWWTKNVSGIGANKEKKKALYIIRSLWLYWECERKC